jgi:RimJ/RimL family protein N-acetyltransferase
MNFRKMTAEDVEFVKDHSASRGIFKNQPDEIDYAYTLENEGQILCIGGIRMINLYSAWAWIDLTHEAGKCITTTYRVIKEWGDSLCKQHNIRRLQAYVETDFPEAIRMVEHLGFKRESTMKNFMGDKDAYLYVRLL